MTTSETPEEASERRERHVFTNDEIDRLCARLVADDSLTEEDVTLAGEQPWLFWDDETDA